MQFKLNYNDNGGAAGGVGGGGVCARDAHVLQWLGHKSFLRLSGMLFFCAAAAAALVVVLCSRISFHLLVKLNDSYFFSFFFAMVFVVCV